MQGPQLNFTETRGILGWAPQFELTTSSTATDTNRPDAPLPDLFGEDELLPDLGNPPGTDELGPNEGEELIEVQSPISSEDNSDVGLSLDLAHFGIELDNGLALNLQNDEDTLEEVPFTEGLDELGDLPDDNALDDEVTFFSVELKFADLEEPNGSLEEAAPPTLEEFGIDAEQHT